MYPLPFIDKFISQTVAKKCSHLWMVTPNTTNLASRSKIGKNFLYHKRWLLLFCRHAFRHQECMGYVPNIGRLSVQGLHWFIIIKIKKIHLIYHKEVFNKLNNYNMKTHPNKCVLRVTLAKFLGHIITTRDIKVDPVKIQVVTYMSPPKSKKLVQKLNGMIIILNRCI